MAAKDRVLRSANSHKRPNAPSFACSIGLESFDRKDEYEKRIKQASDLGVSYIVTGVEREEDYLKLLDFLARDVLPSFG